MKTPEEIEELKRQWQRDGSWDIEDTEGFEGHRDELSAWRTGVEAERAEKRQAHVHEVLMRRFGGPRDRWHAIVAAALTGSAMDDVDANCIARRAIAIADEVVRLCEEKWVP